MKIYFLYFSMTVAIQQFRPLEELALTGFFDSGLKTPDYFGFDIDDFDGAEIYE